MTRPSLTKAIRAAEAEIARHKAARHAPVAMWAGLDETADAFAARVAAVRATTSGPILAALPHGMPAPPGVRPVPFAPRLFALLHPDAPSRYRVASGGRGSGKSHAIAAAIVLAMLSRRLRVLCAREIMRSLRESVHHLLVAKIDGLGLTQYFDVTDREITCQTTGAEIIFAGLWSNANALKSLEDIGLCWIEEGESVSRASFETLTPTIRARGSEIWISFNPDASDAPVQLLIGGARGDVAHEHVTYEHNPWFPRELEAERLYLQSVDPDMYAHVWLGATRSFSDAQVFRGKYAVAEFIPQAGWSGPFVGADWGFSKDPTALVKCWIHEQSLYLEHEAHGVGVDINRTPALFDQVPDSRLYTIRADCSRPETISYMRHHGYPNVMPCDKWTGCVEDGVAFMRSFKTIIVHPRCQHTAEEMRLYSFRVDRLTGDVLPDLLDRHNHLIDALRYALEPLIKRRRGATWSDDYRSFFQR